MRRGGGKNVDFKSGASRYYLTDKSRLEVLFVLVFELYLVLGFLLRCRIYEAKCSLLCFQDSNRTRTNLNSPKAPVALRSCIRQRLG